MEFEENNNGQPPYSAKHPWLLICHGDVMDKQTFFSVSENRYYMKKIPELKEKMLYAYADEWLVLGSIDSNDCCYLWNFISNKKIQLPPLPAECDILNCLLSAPPHDPECLVIFQIKETLDDDDTDDDENENSTDTNNKDEDENENTNNKDEDENDNTNNKDEDENENSDEDSNEDEDEDDEDVNRLTFYFCKPGYNTEFHKQDLQSIIGDPRLGNWTVFKKKIYALIGMQHILICLDVDNDSGRITATPIANESPEKSRRFSDHPCYTDFIIQSSCNDMLLYVHLISNGRNYRMLYHFRVLQFDFVRKRWIKAESIGEIAIFISLNATTTCSTKGTNLNKESIYFTDDRYLYIYDLITQSMSLSLPCPHVSKRKGRDIHWLTLNQ
uniref:KIB1-4 beta-propeller domain-containing protein n=1 Tax=Solanum lycopersicum TaxID=4081 RepID=A0A3Q7HXA6_SOLLC